MSDEFDFGDFFEEPEGRPRDSKVDDAKALLLERFFSRKASKEVFYGRQLEVKLERKFFHWITKKALNELVQEGSIAFCEESAGYLKAHFYWPPRHRYPRRQIRETLALIAEFSDPNFTRRFRATRRTSRRRGVCADWISDQADEGASGRKVCLDQD